MFNFQRALLTSAAVAILLSLAAQAEEGEDPGQGDSQGQGRQRGAGARRAGQRQHMEMLAKKLNLTDPQKQQFQQIQQKMRQQAMSIHNDNLLSDDQKKEKMQGLRKQAHQEMFGVLTPEQKDLLKQIREQHQKEQGIGKGPGDQASNKKTGLSDEDPFAGMTGDDDDTSSGPGSSGPPAPATTAKHESPS